MQEPTAVHVPTVPFHLLPPTVDWRGSPADSPVKNQGACGSCWVRAGCGLSRLSSSLCQSCVPVPDTRYQGRGAIPHHFAA